MLAPPEQTHMNNSSLAMKVFLFSLQQSINKALELDHASRQQLGSLGQQCIKITIADGNVTLWLLLRDGNVELVESHEQQADCDIQCTLKVLLDLINEDHEEQIRFHEDAEISGNADLLISLHQILRSAEPDYEAALSRWLGPVLAHQIGQTIRSGIKWADSVRASVADDIQLYVHEESDLFPHPLEVEAFFSDVSLLQAEVDTLAETLAQLRSEQMKGNPATDQRGRSSCD